MSDIDITHRLHAAACGDQAALDEVTSWAYRELERLAEARLRRRYGVAAAGLTLEPAAVVNETFLKALRHPPEFANRQHYLGFLSKVMLNVLIDYDRERRADKRGGGAIRVTLTDDEACDGGHDGAMVDLAAALDELDRLDARKAAVAKLRLLWGFDIAEIAHMIEASTATAERDWRFGRNWLALRLQAEP